MTQKKGILGWGQFRDVLEVELIKAWQLIGIRGSEKKHYCQISSFYDGMYRSDINQDKKNRVSGLNRKKMR